MDKLIEDFSGPSAWFHRFQPGAVLRVTGEDALSFLQGQFTQELRSKAERPASYGLWLNQKGKVVADGYVLKESSDNLLVVSLSCIAATIRERLEAYVIADDVTIEDVTADWQGAVIGGTRAAEVVARSAGVVPEAGEYGRSADGYWFRGRRGADETWEWLAPREAVLPAIEGVEVSAEALERLRIASGVPRVPVDIGPGDLPNEGGLDDAAVSYTKGCYLGQEVMARLKAMGTLRRRLVRVRAAEHGAPATPCALLQGERRVGELRSAATDGQGGFVGLAMVTKLGLDPALPLAPEPGGEGFIRLVDIP